MLNLQISVAFMQNHLTNAMFSLCVVQGIKERRKTTIRMTRLMTNELQQKEVTLMSRRKWKHDLLEQLLQFSLLLGLCLMWLWLRVADNDACEPTKHPRSLF